MMVGVKHGHLLAQTCCLLTEGMDATANRRYVLTESEMEALHKGRVDLPAMRSQHGLDSLQRAKPHAMPAPDQTPSAHGLDHLGIEPLRQRPPARLGHGAFVLAS